MQRSASNTSAIVSAEKHRFYILHSIKIQKKNSTKFITHRHLLFLHLQYPADDEFAFF